MHKEVSQMWIYQSVHLMVLYPIQPMKMECYGNVTWNSIQICMVLEQTKFLCKVINNLYKWSDVKSNMLTWCFCSEILGWRLQAYSWALLALILCNIPFLSLLIFCGNEQLQWSTADKNFGVLSLPGHPHLSCPVPISRRRRDTVAYFSFHYSLLSNY